MCLLAPDSHAAAVFVIKGVTGELAENIQLLVSKPPEKDNTRLFTRYIDGLPEQVVTAMSAYGYYAAQVNVSVEDVNATEETSTTVTQITIAVTPNEPVKIRNRTVQISDLNDENSDFNTVLDTIHSQLAPGQVFVSSEYEAAKTSILGTAQDLGYFDFAFSTASVAVSRRGKTADITLIAVAGPRYVFGDTLFEQRAFTKTFMQRWSPFEPGDPFSADKLGELTQNLQGSGYFSSVKVRPRVSPRYGKTVPVVVDLTQRDSNQVAVGVGYSTDTRLRASLNWEKPLINSNGHSTEWDLSLASDTQSASIAYRIPHREQPLYNFWGIEYGLQNERENDTESFLSTLNLQRVSRTPGDWTESFFIRWERERFTAGGVEETTDLVLPGFSYSRSRSKGEPFATWGQSLSFQLLGGSDKLLSSIDFLKGVARYRYLRAVAPKHTLIATVQFGAIRSSDNDRVPVTQRFFAGGDRTVRGFAYRDISPRNADGDAVGGRYLEVQNLEYNYRFLDRWSAAVFADRGRAFNDFDTDHSLGAGVGIRWQSPVGPFKIDIATPLSDSDGDNVRLHLSLGTDL